MLIAGVDEAGRGSLISRVYTAAVILPDDFMERAEGTVVIRDSKKLTENQRKRARQFIETHAIAYCVHFAEREEIDRVNILQATINAMHRSIQGLQIPPDRLRIDGSCFRPYIDETGQEIPHECIIRGDDTDPSIACASILAKTYRDNFIHELVHEHPILTYYKIEKNMGYGTPDHIDMLRQRGRTPHHRISFCVKPLQPRLLKINTNIYDVQHREGTPNCVP